MVFVISVVFLFLHALHCKSEWFLLSDAVGDPWVGGVDYPGASQANGFWATSNQTMWLLENGNFWLFDTSWNLFTSLPKQPVYPAKRVASSSATPGAVQASAYFIDEADTLWLFGGFLAASNSACGQDSYLNTVWKFNGADWAWWDGVGTSCTPVPIYGNKGVASSFSSPPGRHAPGWSYSNELRTLFFYGGFTDNGGIVSLNDLWSYNKSHWTWISGTSTPDMPSVYGVLGRAASSNFPGGRAYHTMWVTSGQVIWLFGGYSEGDIRNDLWCFNSSVWIWMSGSSDVNDGGQYVEGHEVAGYPSSRLGSAGFSGLGDVFFLFGGRSFYFDQFWQDLWSYQVGHGWVWLGGSSQPNAFGSSTGTYVPGSRSTLGSQRCGSVSLIPNVSCCAHRCHMETPNSQIVSCTRKSMNCKPITGGRIFTNSVVLKHMHNARQRFPLFGRAKPLEHRKSG